MDWWIDGLMAYSDVITQKLRQEHYKDKGKLGTTANLVEYWKMLKWKKKSTSMNSESNLYHTILGSRCAILYIDFILNYCILSSNWTNLSNEAFCKQKAISVISAIRWQEF